MPFAGGAPARRALVRWALRLFRREWRQQALVLALLGFAVAIAVAGSATAYNMAPRRDAVFGDADHRLVFDVSRTPPDAIDASVAAARDWFGTVDVIGERRVPVPGSVETVELRAQDPDGELGAPMLRLRDGRYPHGRGDVAVTDDVARAYQVGAGDTLDLGDGAWTVTGVVENPHDLDDEFALLSPSSRDELDSLVVLVNAPDERVREFPAQRELGPGRVEARGDTEKEAAASAALAISAVVLLLVCLIAASGFAVVAQRRLRQLGMLAATGATRRQLRLVVVANGAVVGVIAAVGGGLAGLALWIAISPRLETVAAHRIGRLDVPWPQVGLAMLLAIVAATAAAWWPARTMARVAITRALSGRPPRPVPTRRSIVLATLLVAGGVASLMAGIDATKDKADPALVIAGTLAIPLGIALFCPLAIRAVAPVAARLPIAARLAVRDLARYQARAGAALAAVSLGLGLAVAIVVGAAAAEYRPDEGNLSDRQLMLWIDAPDEVGTPESVPGQGVADAPGLTSAVDRIVTALDDPDVLALDVPSDPAAVETVDGQNVRRPVGLARQVGDVYRKTGVLYVATPDALRHVGVEPASVGPDVEVLTDQAGPLYMVGAAARPLHVRDPLPIEPSAYASVPRSFVTPDALARYGWESVPAAWLIENAKPLTDEQLADVRGWAADAGLTVEARNQQGGLSQLRSGATGVGVLLALGILAMTVGLVRAETASDLRTLTAVGAPRRVRRAVTGVTAGALALLGALLGTAGAYAGLAAGYADDLAVLRSVPVANLLSIAIGLPILAAAAAWLLAGREPPSVARSPMD
ncbi:MAG TPA: FtsX-like permease family protein [Acidimicrobiales bacterium]|nr:FtsX-like permease family protein [Acidimicrobiales bacterium]